MEVGRPQTSERPRWTTRHKVIAALFVVAVGVQVTVPAVVVTSNPNRDPDEYLYRFGWQMFTDTELQIRYVAKTAQGETRPLDVNREVGDFWGSVHYGSATPNRLCDADRRRLTITRYALTARGERKAESSFPCL